jgi:hypothetical protein
MATYTSSQSGNFSSSATWGGAGVPGDGDRFDVSSGHTVTIDTGISVPTNGYADSYVYGILQSQASQDTTLRMDGRLYVKGNGLLHLRDGATIQITGTSAEQHGIWVENENGASFIFEGSDGMPCTTLSAAEAESSTSLAVASGTNFAAGEWISVFNHITDVASDTNDHTYQHEDEGFWIHEVSGNTIYFRIFGGPNDVTITSASSTSLFVSNAKVFREGQTIIFGTGSNRNIRTISSINYNRNRLTLDSAVTGTVDGETVYLTGSEKYHTNGSKVRKVATVTTASASSSNTLTVANANMFTAGDDIWIEHRGEADGTTDYIGYYDYSSYTYADRYKHTISSVSGNTITLTSATDYTVVEGALVTRMSRNIVIETTTAGTTDYGFFYAEHTGDYNRKGIIKDVYFNNVGNDDSNAYCGFAIRGYWSTDALSVTLTEQIPARPREPWIEGVIVHAYPDNTKRRDWGPFWLYDCRYAKARCCMAMNGEDGLCGYYEPGTSIVNSIAVANRERGIRFEGSNEWYECAYNYVSRARYGIRLRTLYEHGLGIHDIICDAGEYGITTYDGNSGIDMYRCRSSAFRYGMLSENSGSGLLYSYVKPLSGYPNTDAETGTGQAGSAWNSRFYRSQADVAFFSVEHNYEIDEMSMYGYNWEAKWDNSEKAWRFFRRHNSSDNPAMMERIYIPANTTVRVSAEVKLAPGFSGTYPYLGAMDLISGPGENRIGNSGGADSSRWAGKRYTAQFSASAASTYEEEQLTIASKPYPRNYMIAVFSSSSNAAEGFWIKPIRINIDIPYRIRPFNLVNNQNQFSPIPTQVRSSFTEQKKRIGGRFL